ncbi:MAG: DUF3667 domain-containing protein, partial [Acidobacteriota bacterium]|nr:DUF3667 domain-containing protein [Acidobacteriota bacterium]
CGEPLTGPYCAACGQKDEERILPMKHLLQEVFHDIWHLDARFLKTMGALVRPGALTQEYLDGRRGRWFPPFRLYLMVSLVFFAVASIRSIGSKEFKIIVNRPAQAQVIGLDGKPVKDVSTAAPSRLEKKAEEINRDPSAFVAKLWSWLPRVVFLLLPFFALLLKLAYLRTRTLFAVHAIFSLHEHAFAFLLFSVIKLLGFVPHAGFLRGFLLLALPVHLILGMKRVYGQGWLITLTKAIAVGLLHLGAVLAILVGTTLALMLLT